MAAVASKAVFMETPVREIEGLGAEEASLPAPRRRREGHAPRPVEAARITFTDVVYAPFRGLFRLLFPKLLDRYVFGELLGPFLFGWVLFILLFVLSTNLIKLAGYMARGAPLHEIGQIIALQAVLASVICLPMAVLLSGLMAFNRLSGDSELVATQAGGIPNIRLIRNSLILGLLCSFAGLGLSEYIVPPAAQRLKEMKDNLEQRLTGKVVEELLGDRAFVYQDYDGKQLSRVIIAKKFEPPQPPHRPAMMTDVTYMSYNQGRVEMVVEAASAEWVGPARARGKHMWRFNDANTQLMMRLTPGQRVSVHSDKLDFVLSKGPNEVARARIMPEEMTYRQLKAELKRVRGEGLRGKVVRQMEVMAEQKLSIPFAALILALVGAPLGIRRQRSTAGVGVGLSLLVIVIYYFGMAFSSVMGTNGQMDPISAAWATNVVGLFFGLFLAWRSSR